MAKANKLNDTEKLYYKNKLLEVNQAIEQFRAQGVEPPAILLQKANHWGGKLNTNKFGAKKDSTSVAGETFDSNFEGKVAKMFHKVNIPYESQRKFKLMETFKLSYPEDKGVIQENIQDIEYKADFVIHDLIIIDVKGNKATQTPEFNLKWKLLKNKFRDRYYYILIGNNSELIFAMGKIKRILEERNITIK